MGAEEEGNESLGMTTRSPGVFFPPPTSRRAAGVVQDGPLLLPARRGSVSCIHSHADHPPARMSRAAADERCLICMVALLHSPRRIRGGVPKVAQALVPDCGLFPFAPISFLSPNRQHPDLLPRRYPAHAQDTLAVSALINRVAQTCLRKLTARARKVVATKGPLFAAATFPSTPGPSPATSGPATSGE
jgi:hypothetical protein